MNRWTFQWMVSAAAVLLLLGCDGCYEAQDERRLVLTFVKPQVGAKLTDADDTDRTRAGLQYDVEVKLEWESLTDGSRTEADVSEAGLAVAQQGDAFSDATAGTVGPGGVATFQGVTFLTNGDYQLRATARDLASQQTTDPVTILISVESVPNRPAILTSSVVQDANADLKLNAQELPLGQTLQLAFTTVNLSSGTANVVSNGQVVGTVPVANDQGTVTLNIPPDGGFEGQYTLQFQLQNTAGLQSAPSNSAPDTLVVTIDQVGPTVQITEPTDRDGGYASKTLTATAVVTGAPGAWVTFIADHPDAGTMDAGAVQSDAFTGVATTQVTLFDGRQDLIASVFDSAGNEGRRTVPVFVNTLQCNVTLTSPANGAYIGPSQDAVPGGTTYEFDVTGTAPDCPLQPVTITVGTAQFTGVTDGTGSFIVRVQLQTGQNTVRADVFNGAGLPGSPAVHDVLVGAQDFAITYPQNNVVLNISNDLDAVTPLIQSSFNYTPSALPTGTRVDVCINVAPTMNPQPCPDGSAGFFLLASNIPTPAAGFTYVDGTQYQMKALLLNTANAVLATTPNVTITADSVRPQVSDISFPADANADGKINAAELGTGLSASITLGGVEVGRTVNVFNDTTGAACGTATVTSTTSPTSVSLTCITSPFEGSVTLRVQVTDAAGNANKVSSSTPGADPVNTNAFETFTVDTVAPTFSFTKPTKSALGLADDESSTAGAFQMTVGGTGSADLGSVTFTVAGATTQMQMVTPTGASAEHQFTLNATGDTTYTLTAVAADAAGNSSAAVTRQVRVDLQGPTVTVTQPTSANNPYGSFQLAVTVNVPGESGIVNVYSRVGAVDTLRGTLTLTGGSGTGNITFPNGTQDVVAKFTDAAGNVGEGVSAGIVINAVGCSISLSTPAPTSTFLGRSSGTYVAASNSLTYTVTGVTDCPNRVVSFFEGTGASRTALAANVNTDGAGNFTQTVSYAEGAHHLEVDINNGASVITTASRDFTVDLGLPSISAVTPALATMTLVAPTNVNLRNGVAGYLVDEDPSATAPGAQLTLQYTVNGAPNGTSPGTVSVFHGGSPVAGPFTVSSASQPLSTPVTLTQATSGQLEIRVTDPAGNTASYTANAIVDVVAPTAPAFAVTPVERHAATVSVTWPAAFDDSGNSSSGAAQNFDVRWSTTVVLPSGIQTETEFFDATKTVRHTGALLPAPVTLPLTLTLPPMNTHAILVRAIDEVGNYSGFVSSTQINNVWPTAQFANPNPAANSGYASHLAAGDLNGDRVTDLVTTTWAISPGAAHVLYGSDGGVGAITQQQINPAETGTVLFGSDFDVGQAGDLGSEGIEDLLVSAPSSLSNAGRAYLYFGSSTGLSSAAGGYVIFVGNAASQLGRGAQIVNDITADGLGEILLSAHTEDSGRGRIYMFFGRSKTAWQALATANGGSIPMSAADRQFLGPSPVTGSTNHFGRNRGYASLGDVNGDNVADFTLPDSLDTVNKLFVFSGQTVVSRTAPTGIPTLTTGTTLAVDDSLKPMTAGSPGTGITREGFSSRAVGGLNLFGTGTRDVVVSQPFASTVWVAQGSTSAVFPTPPVSIAGRANSNFGFGLAVGDLNGDGRPDIVAGESATNSAMWIFFSKATGGFDPTAGTGFFQGRAIGTALLGTSTAVGDFNGDGKLDIAAGDPNEAVGGTVTLWY